MLRRIIALALAGVAVTAPAALASPHLNSQMKNASATASRAPGGCTIAKGSHPGTLWISCTAHDKARLTYVFSSAGTVQGRPTRSISYWGDWKYVQSKVKVKAKAKSLRVTVNVSGGGRVLLDSVSVGYYTG